MLTAHSLKPDLIMNDVFTGTCAVMHMVCGLLSYVSTKGSVHILVYSLTWVLSMLFHSTKRTTLSPGLYLSGDDVSRVKMILSKHHHHSNNLNRVPQIFFWPFRCVKLMRRREGSWLDLMGVFWFCINHYQSFVGTSPITADLVCWGYPGFHLMVITD